MLLFRIIKTAIWFRSIFYFSPIIFVLRENAISSNGDAAFVVHLVASITTQI